MEIRDRILHVIDQNPDFSVRKVSLMAGLSDSMLHKFLKGSTRSMTVENLENIAEALGVDSRWLIFGDGSPEVATDIARIIEKIPADEMEKVRRVLEAFIKDAA